MTAPSSAPPSSADVIQIDPSVDTALMDASGAADAGPEASPGDGSPRRARGAGRGAGRGSEARRASRRASGLQQMKAIDRAIPTYELLSENGLALIEHNAETILEETGIIFHDDDEALDLWRLAGADVSGNRVRFPRGLCRTLLKTAPETFVQHARNPDRSVTIGGNTTVFAPVYGPPFVRDLDGGRRYGAIEDFRNIVRLTYATPSLHHSGGTVCEPVDLPVNKRHLDMVQAHLTLTDKPFMGSVTAPSRAEDTVDMARIVFGSDFVDGNCVVINLINANSPLTYDATMLGALKVYARAGQACIVTPFILAGAMAPVTGAGVMAQALAEAMAGMAFAQLIRPGAPVVLGTFASSMSMQSGAPTFGTPEPALILYGMAQLARRLKIPFRSGGSLTASKVADAQAAYESQATLLPTVMAGTNFVLHAAGWLEGGLVTSFEKLVMDADQLGMMHALAAGVDLSENGQAMDAIRDVGPGSHFLGCAHTQANFQTAFYRSNIADNNSFEQWDAEGATDAAMRANRVWKDRLAAYEPPPIDPGVVEALDSFVQQRKAAAPDSWV